MGPGTEALTLGSGWDNISLVRIMTDPIHALTRFHMADGTDPTKRIRWELSDITTGTTRGISCPNWEGRLIIPEDDGTDDYFLKSNGTGTAPTWEAPATVAGLIQHDLVLHSKPFAVANCSWANGSLIIETATANGFANVKVGDYVYLGANTGTSNQGRRVTTINSTTNISVDATNGNSTLSGISIIFQPGDHWDDSLAIDSATTGGGLISSLGRGTYNFTNGSGTFQELRGPFRWLPHNSGNLVTDFRVQASGSTTDMSGFSIFETGATPSGAYFYAAALTANRVFSFPNASGTFVITGGAQTITDKTFDTSNKLQVDGSSTRTVFADSSGNSRIAPSVADVTAERVVSWPNFAGRYALEGAAVTFADADTSPTVVGSRLFKTANTGATSITTFDNGVAGQRIDIIFGDGNTTLVDGASLVLRTGGNYTPAATDTWTGVYDGTVWYELTRSDNT